MKKIVSVVILLLIFGSILCGTVAAQTSFGPSDKSGDGIPDGSEFHDTDFDEGWPNEASPGIGPAPNSGDGIPDGSGF
jgi:hypothetical protein